MNVGIWDVAPVDWVDVERIYTTGIAGGNATFSDAAPSMEEFFASRIPGLNFVAADKGGNLQGWAVAAATSTREVYQGVIEHPVYVDPQAAGKGLGRTLLKCLAEKARTLGYWTIQSSILPENLTLRDKAGFDARPPRTSCLHVLRAVRRHLAGHKLSRTTPVR